MGNDLYNLALQNYSDSKYSMALFAINEYLNQEPDSRPGKLLLALIYGDLCNYGKSFEILEGIKPLKSDNVAFQKFYNRQMGENYDKLGKLDLSLKYYDKFIELDPKSANGYVFKGSCLARMGEYELAKEQHLIATKLDGHPEEAYYNLALIYRAQMDFDQAKIYCQESLRIDPDDKQVKHCLEDIIETIALRDR